MRIGTILVLLINDTANTVYHSEVLTAYCYSYPVFAFLMSFVHSLTAKSTFPPEDWLIMMVEIYKFCKCSRGSWTSRVRV